MRIRFTYYAASFGLALLTACSPAAVLETQHSDSGETTPAQPQRVVSLDYCADQYALKMLAPEHILALSPDAQAPFSYMREAANDLPRVRASAEDVIVLKPDLIIRSYGGGPNTAQFFERAGIPVVNIGWAGDIDGIKTVTMDMANALGVPEKGQSMIDEMNLRLQALKKRARKPSTLYVTPSGATTGPGSLIDELMIAAGLENYEMSPGWRSLPLERLAYEPPDMIAAAFFDINKTERNGWSAARHPIARRQMENLPTVALEGSWMSCGAWFLIDAIEALAQSEGVQ